MSINYIKNYYQILEITQTATGEEIKAAYKRLASKFHPDKTNQRNPNKFIEIREAYEVLKDEVLRKDYDKNYQEPSFVLFREFVTNNFSIQEVEESLKAGASVDAHNAFNQTILMYAINRGNIDMVKFLITNGADINTIDIDGNTPLMYAAIKETVVFEIDNISILKRMFNKFFNESFEENQSEDLDEENSFEFFKRAEEILKQFSSSKLSEKTDSQSNKDKTIIAQILIDNGASIYDINNHNKTVLDYAIDFHNIGLMNLLYTMLGMEDKIIPEHEEVTPVEMSSSLILHDLITEISKIGSKLGLHSLKVVSDEVTIEQSESISNDFEAVFVRHNEDLARIRQEFPHEKVIIYNKRADEKYLGESYLQRIIDNYDEFTDRTIFLQGESYRLEKEEELLFMPLGRYKHSLDESHSVNWGTEFAVDRDTIKAIDKEKYQSILDKDFMLPMADFYLERMWDKVFNQESSSEDKKFHVEQFSAQDEHLPGSVNTMRFAEPSEMLELE